MALFALITRLIAWPLLAFAATAHQDAQAVSPPTPGSLAFEWARDDDLTDYRLGLHGLGLWSASAPVTIAGFDRRIQLTPAHRVPGAAGASCGGVVGMARGVDPLGPAVTNCTVFNVAVPGQGNVSVVLQLKRYLALPAAVFSVGFPDGLSGFQRARGPTDPSLVPVVGWPSFPILPPAARRLPATGSLHTASHLAWGR